MIVLSSLKFFGDQPAQPDYNIVHPKEELGSRRERLFSESAAVTLSLQQCGCKIDSIYDNRISKPEYSNVVAPILISHLEKGLPDEVAWQVASLLVTPNAANCRPRMIALFSSPAPMFKQTRDQLGFAIGRTTSLKMVPETAGLIVNRALRSRATLLVGFKRYRNRPEIAQFVARIQDEPEFSREISSWKVTPSLSIPR